MLNCFRLSLPGASAIQVMDPVGVGVGFAPCLVSRVSVPRTVCLIRASGWIPRLALEMLRCCMISGGRGTVVKEASTGPGQLTLPPLHVGTTQPGLTQSPEAHKGSVGSGPSGHRVSCYRLFGSSSQRCRATEQEHVADQGVQLGRNFQEQ